LTDDKENDPPPLTKLNVNSGLGSYYVDLLIKEELKLKEEKREMRR
jgi:hypothetical protein